VRANFISLKLVQEEHLAWDQEARGRSTAG